MLETLKGLEHESRILRVYKGLYCMAGVQVNEPSCEVKDLQVKGLTL